VAARRATARTRTLRWRPLRSWPCTSGQHITTNFLADVVANCPLATCSDLLPWIMRCSLLARNTDPDLTRAFNISLKRFNRGQGGYEWNVWTCFG